MVREYLRKVRRLFDHKAIVLMYHRVAQVSSDPWELAVRPDYFEEQLAVLKKNFRVLPVHELVDQLQRRQLRSNCVCITFDDGYADNFVNAKPLLEKYQCPASFFIATRYINQKQLFWWDELTRILLDAHQLPAVFSFLIDSKELIFELKEDTILSDAKRRRQNEWIAPDNPPNRRCELYLLVWARLKLLPENILLLSLDRIRLWAGGLSSTDALEFPMSRQQLNSLAQHSLFQLGLHTASHSNMPVLPREVQSQEIMSSRQFLRTIASTGNMLTYPYGAYNDTVVEVVGQEKLDAAFTTDERIVTKRSHIYRLGRFQAKNWTGDKFEKQLQAWIKNK